MFIDFLDLRMKLGGSRRQDTPPDEQSDDLEPGDDRVMTEYERQVSQLMAWANSSPS